MPLTIDTMMQLEGKVHHDLLEVVGVYDPIPDSGGVGYILLKEQNEKIRLNPMTKAPIPTEKSKKQRDNT